MHIDTASWGWPQWVYVSLSVISLFLSAYYHGKPKKGVYSFWVALVSTLLGLTLLGFGGFFGGHQ